MGIYVVGVIKVCPYARIPFFKGMTFPQHPIFIKFLIIFLNTNQGGITVRPQKLARSSARAENT